METAVRTASRSLQYTRHDKKQCHAKQGTEVSVKTGVNQRDRLLRSVAGGSNRPKRQWRLIARRKAWFRTRAQDIGDRQTEKSGGSRLGDYVKRTAGPHRHGQLQEAKNGGVGEE
jgi:hypothetical protein